MDYHMFRREYLLGCLGKLLEGLKAIVGNRVKPDYHFIRIAFCYFLFLSARFLCSLVGYAEKHASTYRTLLASARLRFEERI